MKLRIAVFAAGLALGGAVAPRPRPPGAHPGLARRAGRRHRAARPRGLRRRLLLVHGGVVREGPGRRDRGLGLRGRQGEEPVLRAGLGGHDRATPSRSRSPTTRRS